MKKLIFMLFALTCVQFAYAADSANIKIKISGVSNNRYFLCIPDMGCLSILAAQKGKVFPILRDIDMNTIFVTDTNNYHVHSQGLPDSCNVVVKTNQTITIYGKLVVKPSERVQVNQLRCSVS